MVDFVARGLSSNLVCAEQPRVPPVYVRDHHRTRSRVEGLLPRVRHRRRRPLLPFHGHDLLPGRDRRQLPGERAFRGVRGVLHPGIERRGGMPDPADVRSDPG